MTNGLGGRLQRLEKAAADKGPSRSVYLWGLELTEAEIERQVIERCGTAEAVQVVLVGWHGS